MPPVPQTEPKHGQLCDSCIASTTDFHGSEPLFAVLVADWPGENIGSCVCGQPQRLCSCVDALCIHCAEDDPFEDASNWLRLLHWTGYPVWLIDELQEMNREELEHLGNGSDTTGRLSEYVDEIIDRDAMESRDRFNQLF